MMSVNLGQSAVWDFIRKHDLSTTCASITVACLNSPTNSTLSGDEEAIHMVKSRLDEAGIFAQTLSTGVAYHSPAMKSIVSEYLSLLGYLVPAHPEQNSPAVMISTVTGKPVDASALSNPEYWCSNLVNPVKFLDAISTTITDVVPEIATFIEVGPHGALRRPLRDTLSHISPKPSIGYISALDRTKDPVHSILELLGYLFCNGYPVSIIGGNLTSPHSGHRPFLVDCPGYAFDHTNVYWSESRLSRDFRLRDTVSGGLLGDRVSDWNPLEPRWRQALDVEVLPWLSDYSVRCNVSPLRLYLALTKGVDLGGSSMSCCGFSSNGTGSPSPSISNRENSGRIPR